MKFTSEADIALYVAQTHDTRVAGIRKGCRGQGEADQDKNKKGKQDVAFHGTTSNLTACCKLDDSALCRVAPPIKRTGTCQGGQYVAQRTPETNKEEVRSRKGTAVISGLDGRYR